jgi:hypothetical protein
LTLRLLKMVVQQGRSDASEVYPLGYVAARVATENEAGDHFQ